MTKLFVEQSLALPWSANKLFRHPNARKCWNTVDSQDRSATLRHKLARSWPKHLGLGSWNWILPQITHTLSKILKLHYMFNSFGYVQLVWQRLVYQVPWQILKGNKGQNIFFNLHICISGIILRWVSCSLKWYILWYLGCWAWMRWTQLWPLIPTLHFKIK